MNIFIHYLDKEVLETIPLPKDRTALESELIVSIKIALLLCSDYVYIPFSNYCESTLAKNVVESFRQVSQLAAIKLVSSSTALEDFLEKKLNSYEIYQSSKIQEQIDQTIERGIPGVWEQRHHSATSDITAVWGASIGDNFWDELRKLTNYKKISRFEKELSLVPYRLHGKVFVAGNVLPVLNIKEKTKASAKKLINTQITQAYIKSYLDEFDCICFKDMFLQGISIDYLLPKGRYKHVSYATVCRLISSHTYQGKNLFKWLKECSVYEIFELKNTLLWQEIISEVYSGMDSNEQSLGARTYSCQEGEGQMKTFIVHGHADMEKLALKNYIQNTLKLGEPCILAEMPSQGRTIIEKFESIAEDVSVVFVLLTPDDKFEDGDRPRQNVIFELGYFLGKLGRDSGRILLLYKGTLDLPSDLSGIVYINIDHGIEAAGEQIRRELSGIISDRL